jgi:8-oxo-dGTP diphosphatase
MPGSEIGRIIDVAAAVMIRSDGRLLLAKRPHGRPYPGYWEFPGGKIEPGETAVAALARELREELGIQVRRAHRWLTRIYSYPHATVRLRFFRVTEWCGEPQSLEVEDIAWIRSDALNVAPILPANGPVLRALALPFVYAISNAAELGSVEFLMRLELALQRGLRLLQFREKQLPEPQHGILLERVIQTARRYSARVLVNGGDVSSALSAGADGVHLPTRELMAARIRPHAPLCGGSCHNAEELARAAQLELDFVVLGPVLPTPSHRGAKTMGWSSFSELIRDYPLPVYAIGGMRPGHLDIAQQHGAHGVSMMRAIWETED